VTVFALNALVAAMTGLFLVDAWRQTLERARRDVENLNLVLSGDLEAHFSRIDFCLQRIVEAFVDPATKSIDDMQPVVDREAARLKGVNGIRVVNAEGEVKLESNGRISRVINIADKERFQVQRDHPDLGLYVSKPELGHLHNRWLFTLGRRLARPDGAFGGEVHATVALEEIERMFAQLHLQPHGVVSLWTDEPQPIVRFPSPGGPGNLAQFPPSPTLRSLVANRVFSGHYEADGGSDGIHRFFFLRRLADLPLYLIVGEAEQDLFAEWLRHALQFGAIYLVFAAASCAGGAVFHARAASR
jgi:hypothetical protein